jgi:hypothetical protein
MLLIPRERLADIFPVELSMTPATAVISAGVKLLERALVDGDVGALRYYLLTHGGEEWAGPSSRAAFRVGGGGDRTVSFIIEGFGGVGIEGGGVDGLSEVDGDVGGDGVIRVRER